MPWLGFAETNVSPAGSRSVPETPVAVAGPKFDTVNVNVTVSPTFGVALFTLFVTLRSACRAWASTAAIKRKPKSAHEHARRRRVSRQNLKLISGPNYSQNPAYLAIMTI